MCKENSPKPFVQILTVREPLTKFPPQPMGKCTTVKWAAVVVTVVACVAVLCAAGAMYQRCPVVTCDGADHVLHGVILEFTPIGAVVVYGELGTQHLVRVVIPCDTWCAGHNVTDAVVLYRQWCQGKNGPATNPADKDGPIGPHPSQGTSVKCQNNWSAGMAVSGVILAFCLTYIAAMFACS